MQKHNTSSNSLNPSPDKDRDKFTDDLCKTYQALLKEPKTMLQVAKQLNIERASICWYVKKLRDSNKIAVYRKGLCPISLNRAGFLTTDPNKFPKKSSL